MSTRLLGHLGELFGNLLDLLVTGISAHPLVCGFAFALCCWFWFVVLKEFRMLRSLRRGSQIAFHPDAESAARALAAQPAGRLGSIRSAVAVEGPIPRPRSRSL